MTPVKMDDPPNVKKRLSYIADRKGFLSIAKLEFFELARNYVTSSEISEEVLKDAGRLLYFMTLKGYYNTGSDILSTVAPYLRYVLDPKMSMEDLHNIAKTSYGHESLRETLSELLPLLESAQSRVRLIDAIDAVRTDQYRTKISKERAINWSDKGDSKKDD